MVMIIVESDSLVYVYREQITLKLIPRRIKILVVAI